MWKQMINALAMMVVLTVITGVVYPLVMTGIAQAVFPAQANGSLLWRDGKPVGSSLIGQNYDSPAYFHGRPSAAGEKGYDGAGSSGSNLGPTNAKLVEAVKKNVTSIREENKLAADTPVPSDLALASASGLDPHISPAAASVQAARVSEARAIPETEVQRLIDAHTQGRQLGILGEPRVNVLELNLALDALHR